MLNASGRCGSGYEAFPISRGSITGTGSGIAGKGREIHRKLRTAYPRVRCRYLMR
ncbi:MAG TPA: hypothetical protein PLF54_02915 [Deltaproteobacteria bacterium]|nr:hypothetical protein [Deltaproteobacteria bacterium]